MIYLISICIVALLGYRLYKSANSYSYGASLEEYILKHHPRHSGDVDRLTAEYNYKVSRGLL